ncbi:hypothetical protein SEA_NEARLYHEADLESS_57 [Mycobacterium phage NearlyHeadless]|nr:hypothetical protein SEA_NEARLYHEADLESS_57 [Mycobacterium phage NearlyHeadless]
MSVRQLRKIGEVVTKADIEIVEDTSDEEVRLLLGSRVLAIATDESLDGDGRWNVNIQDGQYRTNSFYVIDQDEAVDALEDIGVIYLAAKNGEL